MDEYSKQNPPAFPRDHAHNGHNGMSLRDWFAGQAMAAVAAPEPLIGVATARDIDAIARCAYQIADAMLVERTVVGRA